VAEFITLSKATSVRMIESEMCYNATHLFTTHNPSIVLFYFDEATAAKTPL
jgi:hypothetical protein